MHVLEQADVVISVGYDLVEYHPRLWNNGVEKKILHIDFLPAEVDRRITRFRQDAQNAVRSDSTDLHARLAALAADVDSPTPALARLAAGPSRRLGAARELDRILTDLEAR